MSPKRAFVLALAGLATACGARTGLGDHAAARDASVARDAFVSPVRDAGHDAFSPDAFSPDAWRAAVDAGTDAYEPDAGNPCTVDDAPLAGPICERTLDAHDPTLSCPGGFVDVVAQGVGTLRWECDGRRAEATFGARGLYRGTRDRDRFALCIRTEFDYLDGCRWQSSQRIEGSIDTHVLTLTYSESPIVSDGTCSLPCTAASSIDVP